MDEETKLTLSLLQTALKPAQKKLAPIQRRLANPTVLSPLERAQFSTDLRGLENIIHSIESLITKILEQENAKISEPEIIDISIIDDE